MFLTTMQIAYCTHVRRPQSCHSVPPSPLQHFLLIMQTCVAVTHVVPPPPRHLAPTPHNNDPHHDPEPCLKLRLGMSGSATLHSSLFILFRPLRTTFRCPSCPHAPVITPPDTPAPHHCPSRCWPLLREEGEWSGDKQSKSAKGGRCGDARGGCERPLWRRLR